ncbi:MAG: OsmC family protein [Flavobacteriaceae bacterium]
MKLNIDIKFDNNGRIVPFMNGREVTMNDSPFVVFLATAGMCSAVFVKAFIEQRGLSLEGLVITQVMEYDQRTNHVSEILIDIKLPADFPEKYTNAIKKVVNQCPVKQHLLNPPTFEVVTNLDKVAVN